MSLVRSIIRQLLEKGRNEILEDGFCPLTTIVIADGKAHVTSLQSPTEKEKELLKLLNAKLINELNAEAAFVLSEVWMAPCSRLDHWQGSLEHHPHREAAIAVCGADFQENLIGLQQMFRSGNEVTFGEESIENCSESWFDTSWFRPRDILNYCPEELVI